MVSIGGAPSVSRRSRQHKQPAQETADQHVVDADEATSGQTRLTFLPSSMNPQTACPLFSILPGEVRNHIWSYALSPYPNPDKAYLDKTCYKRPECSASQTTSVALLRTCKAIYAEAWYLPWVNSDLTFYLTWNERRPEKSDVVYEVQETLRKLHAADVDTSVNSVRVYAQLFNLESGKPLRLILGMEHFKPKYFTITIRHTDCWNWESDETLRVGGSWVNGCEFPSTTREIRIEFESLERKKKQVDEIAAQAVKGWQFRTTDGRIFVASLDDVETMQWSGSSTWECRRWLRDEVRPGQLDYYIRTVVWKPQRGEERTHESDGASNTMAKSAKRPAVDLIAQHVPPVLDGFYYATESQLEAAKANDPDMPVAEVKKKLDEWRADLNARRASLNAANAASTRPRRFRRIFQF